MDAVDVAGRVRAYRKLKGYTQRELAAVMDVPLYVIGRLERGTHDLNADKALLLRVCTFLDIKYYELMKK